ncbi:MAG: ATP-binding cassette domain-containing protein [bacterium]
MVELRDCWKAYGRVPALRGVDLEIGAGTTTVLIGPSGCGKSTILRLVTGLARPDRGDVYFEAAQVRTRDLPRLRLRMGYVIQSGGLFPHLSARGNVTLMARYLRWDPGRIEGRLLELARLTRFPADALERYPIQLSGGQKQRLALMRALMLDPSVLLLDEPLGALDPVIRFDLQTDLRAIFQELRKSVLWVTHDLDEAAYFADQVVLMHEGRVKQQGTIRQMLEAPADPFVTRFVQAQRHAEVP